ncbi:MAG: VOC family protein [Chloroflexota bacterium]
MKLTHVRLLVTDFPACFRFYRDSMGFAATWGDENSGYASFVAGEDATLALFDRQAQAEAVGAASLPLEAACQDKAMLIFEVDNLA